MPREAPKLHGFELAVARFKLDSKDPLIVKPFVAKPLFKRLTIRRFELDQHFAFNHVDLNSPRLYVISRRKPRGQLIRALPSEASQRVERNVAWHAVPFHHYAGQIKPQMMGKVS